MARTAGCPCGTGRRVLGAITATNVTRHYLAGELSVRLGQLQAAAATEAAAREAAALRNAAETRPLSSLETVAARALVLAEDMCWCSLERGDAEAFARQAALGADLHEFAVCAHLLDDA